MIKSFPDSVVRSFPDSVSKLNSGGVPEKIIFKSSLAGQIYAMAGMQTHLHVLANEPGVFRGFSSNYSGYGFSQMRFKAHSVSQADFDKWVADVKAGNGSNYSAVQKQDLDFAGLQALRDGERSEHQIEGMIADAKTPEEKAAAEALEELGTYPHHPHPVTYYSSVEPQLFKQVIGKYMSNYHGAEQAHATAGE